jgi:hypothetical protein
LLYAFAPFRLVFSVLKVVHPWGALNDFVESLRCRIVGYVCSKRSSCQLSYRRSSRAKKSVLNQFTDRRSSRAEEPVLNEFTDRRSSSAEKSVVDEFTDRRSSRTEESVADEFTDRCSSRAEEPVADELADRCSSSAEEPVVTVSELRSGHIFWDSGSVTGKLGTSFCR